MATDTTAAERMRRLRQRRATGARPVQVDVPDLDQLQSTLVVAGYLDPDGVGDRQAVRRAIADLLEDVAETGITP